RPFSHHRFTDHQGRSRFSHREPTGISLPSPHGRAVPNCDRGSWRVV
ncbi:uncharacterized protein METZ01_LOCUS121916, partial [marine metagenome]